MTTSLRVVAWVGIVISVISLVLLSIAKNAPAHPRAFAVSLVMLAGGAAALAQVAAHWWSGRNTIAAQRASHWSRKAFRAIGVAVAVTALIMLVLVVLADSTDEEARMLANAPIALFSAFLAALLVELVQANRRSEARP